MNEIVLAELGRSPLQFHFWQQILRFHHRELALRKSSLVNLHSLRELHLDQMPNVCSVIRNVGRPS